MVVLGIIILLAVGAVTATVIANGSETATLNLVGVDVTTNIAGIYAVGALCLLLAVLGVFLTLGGAKRARRRRREVRSLRRQADQPAGSETPIDPRGEPHPQGGDPIVNERAAGRRRRRDGGPDDHFEGVPRD